MDFAFCTLTLGALSALHPAPLDAASDATSKGRATVRLEATQPVVVGAHRLAPRSGAVLERPGPFSRLCTAPCTTELPVGNHQLAVLREDERPLLAFPAFRLSGPTTLKLEVVSRAEERTLGFWVTVITASIGAASTTIGLLQTCGDSQSCARNASAAIWGGIGFISFGGTFGVPLLLRDDEITLRIGPTSNVLGISKRY